ncbi:MAG: SdpI family protein [Chitinophagaceae bacterium]|nr:SdpI family protein [Chitinophagaceae bacterium]
MNSFLKKIIWPIIAIPGIYLALVWNKLPEQVAMHFNLKGEPDRMGSKNELLASILILMAVNIVMFLILSNIYRIDPKRSAPENKDRLIRIAFATTILLTGVSCLIIYSASHGNIRFNSGWILAGVGLFFALIGNYMYNIKPNYFAGLRLPWTLENEDNWKKTHQLAGRIWFGGGILIALLCLLLPPTAGIIVFFILILIMVTIPVVFSYQYYKKHRTPNV